MHPSTVATAADPWTRVGGTRAELTIAAANAAEALDQAETEVKSIEELAQVRTGNLIEAFASLLINF